MPSKLSFSHPLYLEYGYPHNHTLSFTNTKHNKKLLEANILEAICWKLHPENINSIFKDILMPQLTFDWKRIIYWLFIEFFSIVFKCLSKINNKIKEIEIKKLKSFKYIYKLFLIQSLTYILQTSNSRFKPYIYFSRVELTNWAGRGSWPKSADHFQIWPDVWYGRLF